MHTPDQFIQSSPLQWITEVVNDAVITANASGHVTFWNAAAERLFQYTSQEITGRPLTTIIPGQYREAHEQGIQRILQGGPAHVIGKTVELHGLRKDGTIFPIELSLSTWNSPEGRCFGGIIRDISRRRHAEQLIRDAELRFRSIMATANDAIIAADANGKILSWNRAAERIFGYEEEEVMGRSLTMIIPQQYRALHEEGMKRVASGGPAHVIGSTVELSGLHKSGNTFPLELSLSAWEIDGQKNFCGIIRDITHRKAAEMQLRENESRFRSITETANDAIITANQYGVIESWNKAAEKIFGYSAAEATGKPLTLIIPDRYKKAHEEGLRRVAGGGQRNVIGHTAELTGLHKNGHTFPIELSLSAWERGPEVFFCGIIRDITERKTAEAELKKSRKRVAEKAQKLKTANEEIREKNEQLQALSNKLAKYLSQQVYKSIFTGKKDVKIESYRKYLTVFFSDIHDFTELTDRIESELLTTLLNRYLNEMTKIAIDFGGTIDKYIGDAIMIFFGDPETLGPKQDAVACVKMALKMRERLSDLQKEWQAMGIVTPLEVRMGINSGYCTVGNFGSEERLDYTIVGGPVNLASRLESAAMVNQILISHTTYSLVHDEIACEKKEEMKVKGQAYPVQTYQVSHLLSNDRKEEEIHTELAGFNISVNFEKMSYTDRLLAREILQKAINKL
ncbi:MAG TPA: PAS domain S-box protein [Flavisolibacter sp.]